MAWWRKYNLLEGIVSLQVGFEIFSPHFGPFHLSGHSVRMQFSDKYSTKPDIMHSAMFTMGLILQNVSNPTIKFFNRTCLGHADSSQQ